jgi:hypothetical protein
MSSFSDMEQRAVVTFNVETACLVGISRCTSCFAVHLYRNTWLNKVACWIETNCNQQREVAFTSQTIRGGYHWFIGFDPISQSTPRGGVLGPVTSPLLHWCTSYCMEKHTRLPLKLSTGNVRIYSLAYCHLHSLHENERVHRMVNIRIWEVLGSNPGPETQTSVCFSSGSPRKCRDSTPISN